jgi:hypothetical protein
MSIIKIRARVFKLFFFWNFAGVLLSLPLLGFCYQHILEDGKGHDFFFHTEKEYWNLIGLLFMSALPVQVLIYLVDLLWIIVQALKKKVVNPREFGVFGAAVQLTFGWVFLLICFYSNGQYDLIIGPADTGLILALVIAGAISYWKSSLLKTG